MNNEQIGKIIRSYRVGNSLSLRQMANDLNVSFSALAKMENGEQRIESEFLIKISDYFNVSLDQMLNRSESKVGIQGGTSSNSELFIHKMMERVLTEYQQARNVGGKGHPLSEVVRIKMKETLFKEAGLDPNIYHVVGSVGIGLWAEIPWVSIFIKDLTISATRGYYIVYLFNADGSGLYVSLNQGWTYFKEKYGTKIGREKIRDTARIVRENLNTMPQNMNLLSIDLKGRGDLARGYELGHICGRFYDADNLSSSEEILNDLQGLLLTYKEVEGLIGNRSIEQFNDYILLNEDGLFLEDEASEEEYQFAVQESVISKKSDDIHVEDQKKERPEPTVNKGGRKQWTRNAVLASKALMFSNYTCEIEGSHETFISKSTNMPYVESHHLIPMARQKDFQYDLDQLANLISLCPLCHRLIHLGTDEEKEKLLRKLFDQRRGRLETIGIEITFSDLKRVYGISTNGGV
ncbi:5-methylcytosine-specific restriction protein A [Peribacillus sp. V2I11]|nr:5-methylcytosine-specific restriction protein A [Peribacillus sp. V2I11]